MEIHTLILIPFPVDNFKTYQSGLHGSSRNPPLSSEKINKSDLISAVSSSSIARE
jgi:hypothetical protein